MILWDWKPERFGVYKFSSILACPLWCTEEWTTSTVESKTLPFANRFTPIKTLRNHKGINKGKGMRQKN